MPLKGSTDQGPFAAGRRLTRLGEVIGAGEVAIWHLRLKDARLRVSPCLTFHIARVPWVVPRCA